TAAPGDALRAGADYIVVGRPIIRACDPSAAARSLIGEMAAILRSAPASVSSSGNGS
ncbi:MAG: orotidine 5'-phosphate decarboxylase / HUMPS family protein, partial [Rhodomicrobium sp.]